MSELIYKLNKTEKDIDALLLQHKNLVYFMLSSSGQLYNPDCESAAWEALWDAICTFDVFSKTQFSTYACTLIRNAVNNELRKQAIYQKRECAMFEYGEQSNLCATVDTEDVDIVNRIEEAFSEYLKSTSGIVRNVLLVWNASGYEATCRDIASMCATSPSYVSRIQSGFRAYLQRKIKGP